MAIDSIKKFVLRWGPAILVMGLIFFFSSIPIKITLPLVRPFRLTPKLVLSKSAHMLGYALLALTIQRGLQLRGWKGKVVTMICVLLYALSDEFHQSFVPGRGGSIIDVGIDLLGGTMGVWIGRKLNGVMAMLSVKWGC